jgi:hypothetical protein
VPSEPTSVNGLQERRQQPEELIGVLAVVSPDELRRSSPLWDCC